MLPPNFWTWGVSLFLHGTSFMRNTNPWDQARCTKSMAWKKRYDGLDLQDTSDRKKPSLRQKNGKFYNSNSPWSCCCSVWAFLGSSCRWSFCEFIWKRSAESFSSSASQKRNRKSGLEVFYKKVFLAISQSLQGNICAKISFLRKLKTSRKFFKKEIPA